MNDVLTVLKEAFAKISNPENWTRGVYARNAQGRSVLPEGMEACKFCALGAVYAAAGSSVSATAFIAEDKLNASARMLYPEYGTVIGVNDQHSHEAVKAVYEDAIAKAESASE